jgi:hypothetical protein
MSNGALLPLAVALFAAVPSPTSPEARSVDQKLERIQSGHARPGSTVLFTEHELNVWVAAQVPHYAPEGVRETHLELGNGVATGSAIVDFLKMRQAQGVQTSWLISKLIQGEHPVTVTARLQSAHGEATVYLQEVQLSGMTISGGTLDFLVTNFFHPLFPDAKIDQPFPLAENVERIEVDPGVAKAVIRSAPPGTHGTLSQPKAQ